MIWDAPWSHLVESDFQKVNIHKGRGSGEVQSH